MGFGWSNTSQSPSFFICHCPADIVLNVGQGIGVNNWQTSLEEARPYASCLYCTILTALSLLLYLYCTVYTIHSPEGARPLETPPENEGTK